MNNNIFYSADYNNENFTGLFDRIINIKFIRKNGDSFTLRSDYEPVWEGGVLYFKTCQPKPAIRVKYTQYQATMIAVDIFVTNLNIIEYQANKAVASEKMNSSSQFTTRTGNTTNMPNDILSTRGNPVVHAEIEMGYRGDFHPWYREKSGGSLTAEQLYKSFLNLEKPGLTFDRMQITEAQSFFKQTRRCHVRVEWAANISNPPDRITQFHGYIGSTEAGFQPLSNLALDNTAIGTAGQITEKTILAGLNDPYSTIDEVDVKSIVNEEKTVTKTVKGKKKKVKELIPKTIQLTTYRNFFNGGQPFTLLEAFCFHTLTRRFLRTNIEAKRNPLLEQAALEYSLASIYPENKQQLSDRKEELAQKIYSIEAVYNPTNFIKTDGLYKFSNTATKEYQNSLNELINKRMIDTYIGARYTIKNLPEHRKMYDGIRKILKEAALKEEYMEWGDAANRLKDSSEKNLAPAPGVVIQNNIQSVKQFIMESDNGKYEGSDCYFELDNSKDWILSLQSSETDAILKDTKQRELIFYPPTELAQDGFVTSKKAKSKKIRCFSGLFEVRDAYLFGIPVRCTKEASEVFEKQQAGKSYIDFIFLPNVKAQIEWICSTWNLLYYTTNDGGFIIYCADQNERSIASQEFVTNQSGDAFRIPAVYDITLEPIRKIRMPFVAFLDPMRVVEWNSSTSIGSMISFYHQPAKGKNFFMTIKNDIDFSTVEDYNSMEIDLVDTQYVDKTSVPAAVIQQKDKKYFIDVLIIPNLAESLMDTWKKIYESPITKIPVEMLGLWTQTENKETNLSQENRVSITQFFNMLQVWNPSLFLMSTEEETGWSCLDSFLRVDKKANKLYRPSSANQKINFPEIYYCFSFVEANNKKRIYLKYPFMPSEADYATMVEHNKDYVLVYQNGVWEMVLKNTIGASYQLGAI